MPQRLLKTHGGRRRTRDYQDDGRSSPGTWSTSWSTTRTTAQRGTNQEQEPGHRRWHRRTAADGTARTFLVEHRDKNCCSVHNMAAPGTRGLEETCERFHPRQSTVLKVILGVEKGTVADVCGLPTLVRSSGKIPPDASTAGLKFTGFGTYGLALGVPALQIFLVGCVSMGSPEKLAS